MGEALRRMDIKWQTEGPTGPLALRKYRDVIRFLNIPSDDIIREARDDIKFPDDVRDNLNLITAYLALPILAYKLKTPKAIETFRDMARAKDPIVSLLHENNKMRMNTVSWALTGVENLLPYLEWGKSMGLGNIGTAHEEMMERVRKIWKNPNPSLEEKAEYITELIDFLHHVFDMTQAIFADEKLKNDPEKMIKGSGELYAIVNVMKQRAKEWEAQEEEEDAANEN